MKAGRVSNNICDDKPPFFDVVDPADFLALEKSDARLGLWPCRLKTGLAVNPSYCPAAANHRDAPLHQPDG